MESLLALAFDNLSSYDSGKVKKGVRQVDGMLASLCLDSANSRTSRSPRKGRKRGADFSDIDAPGTPHNKSLDELVDDPAFHEFFKTQEGFQFNIATHLLETLGRLVGHDYDGQYDLVMINVLDLMQGILLLHPPSKKLFAREQNMNLILDLIEPVNCPAIQTATLSVLTIALIGTPENTRCFEALDGLLAVMSLYNSRGLPRSTRAKVTEVLYVYLMPEVPSNPHGGASDSLPGLLQHGSSKLPGVFAADPPKNHASSVRANTVSIDEKVKMLSRYLGNVDEFVQELHSHGPFEGITA